MFDIKLLFSSLWWMYSVGRPDLQRKHVASLLIVCKLSYFYQEKAGVLPEKFNELRSLENISSH